MANIKSWCEPMRAAEPIDIAEFRNVVGRAGRAYVDVEGLVLMPMFDRVSKRRADWKEMVENAKGKEMESGLLRLLMFLVRRMIQKSKPKNVEAMIDYLAGVGAWDFPVLATEGPDLAETESGRWAGYLTTLDTALLSMLGEQDVPDDQVETMLDDVLASSLWSRRLARRNAQSLQLWGSCSTAFHSSRWPRKRRFVSASTDGRFRAEVQLSATA